MSTQYNTQPQQPLHMPVNAPVPTKPKSKRKWLLPVLVAVALLFGFGIGSVSNPAPPPVETIKEEKVIVEKEVKVPTTPATCTVALDYAEEVIQSAGRTVGVFSEIIDAVRVLDAAEITRLNPKIDAETEILTGVTPKYQLSAAACRAAAK